MFLDIDIQGGLAVQEALGAQSWLLYVLPPDMETLTRRLTRRGTDDEATVALRLKNALGELAVLPRYDAVVVNDDLAAAVERARILLASQERNCARWLDEGGRALLAEGFGVRV